MTTKKVKRELADYPVFEVMEFKVVNGDVVPGASNYVIDHELHGKTLYYYTRDDLLWEKRKDHRPEVITNDPSVVWDTTLSRDELIESLRPIYEGALRNYWIHSAIFFKEKSKYTKYGYLEDNHMEEITKFVKMLFVVNLNCNQMPTQCRERTLAIVKDKCGWSNVFIDGTGVPPHYVVKGWITKSGLSGEARKLVAKYKRAMKKLATEFEMNARIQKEEAARKALAERREKKKKEDDALKLKKEKEKEEELKWKSQLPKEHDPYLKVWGSIGSGNQPNKKVHIVHDSNCNKGLLPACIVNIRESVDNLDQSEIAMIKSMLITGAISNDRRVDHIKLRMLEEYLT